MTEKPQDRYDVANSGPSGVEVSRWLDLTGPEIADLEGQDPVAVLPLGAIEQHGPHLPVSTDLDLAQGIIERAAAQVSPELPVVLLPALPFGASLEHRALAGTLDLDADVLGLVIHACGSALARMGWRRLVIFNTHGGNTALVDEVALRLRAGSGMLVIKAHSFRFPRPPGLDLPSAEWRHGLHGGAVETSMMSYLKPDAVRWERVERFPSLGEELPGALTYVAPEGPISFAWLAEDLNPHGSTGDASLASFELGRHLVEHYADVLARVIEDATRFPIARLGGPI